MPSDPTLYLYTSLTAGSSHIITATSRIETILKANKIPFRAVDCATDTKARLLWQRRSKNRKLPGLVKYNDVIADLEQVEEWNEYGELEEQIEDQVDIFGDVPISETSAEAHATSAQRIEASKAAQAQKDAEKNDPALKDVKEQEKARTAVETRHISISEPTVNMAMRQAGVEAAKKAGELKKAQETKSEVAKSGVNSGQDKDREAEIASKEAAAVAAGGVKIEEESEATEAKTPEVLAAEGKKKISVDKITSPGETGEFDDIFRDETDVIGAKSNEEQIIDQRRKSSIVQQSSSLAKATSIDEADTMAVDEPESMTEKVAETSQKSETSKKDVEDVKKQPESKTAGGKVEENAETEAKEPPKKAAKISATDDGEDKVLKGSKPQDQKAADGSKAGESVGD